MHMNALVYAGSWSGWKATYKFTHEALWLVPEARRNPPIGEEPQAQLVLLSCYFHIIASMQTLGTQNGLPANHATKEDSGVCAHALQKWAAENGGSLLSLPFGSCSMSAYRQFGFHGSDNVCRSPSTTWTLRSGRTNRVCPSAPKAFH